MADLFGFNAQEVEPAVPFDPMPNGTYTAIITASEMKPTRSGSGEYLQLTFQVVEGEYQGRTLWARLNLKNPNTMAVKMARAELSAICRATGVMAPRDSAELHNSPLRIKVAVKRRSDTQEFTNEIKGYEPRAAAAPVATSAAPGSVPPWQRS